jgi:hypothetical protein
MANRWDTRGQKLVQDLRGTTDNQTIESLAKVVVSEIVDAYESLNSRRVPLTAVRKAVQTAFKSTKKQTSDNQYFTKSGKGNIPRYEHIALKYLTLPKEDWDGMGDEARKVYEISQTTVEPQPETITEFSLSAMKIEQLELDTETQQTVLDALEHSGKSLAEFIQQACKVYAKTVTGKARKYGDNDLSTVPTSELLDPNNKDYKTHPKKIEELTKRAIFAIEQYNNEIATEVNQKWFISATAINGLTGSRVQSVNEILKADENRLQRIIDSHNKKHELTAYTNRGNGRKIENDIDLSELVPDGLDL